MEVFHTISNSHWSYATTKPMVIYDEAEQVVLSPATFVLFWLAITFKKHINVFQQM